MATNDKQRLLDQRAKVEEQKEKIDAELAGIDRELAIHDIIEKIREGTLDPVSILNPIPTAVIPKAASTGSKGPRGPRGNSERSKILELLKPLPDGLSAKDVADQLGITDPKLKGSVATALSNMAKAGQLTKEEGRGGRYKITAPQQQAA